MSLPLDTPLPIVDAGAPAWILSAEWAELLSRKVNAMIEMRAEPPIKLTKSDAGFLFSAGQGYGTPTGAVTQWVQATLCINNESRTVWVFGAVVPQ